MKRTARYPFLWLALALFLTFTGYSLSAQEQAPAAAAGQAGHEAQQQQPENPNAAIGSELSEASHRAEETAEHEENAQFKYSPTVQWIAKHLNADPHLAYFISLLINFGLLALFFWVLLRSKIPALFRNRTASIQKALREAQEASADATARLSAIEARLSRIDGEIVGIRTEAEKNAVAEEARIRAAAEQDKQKVVESAKAEIDSIARNARRELKSYAASLAIDAATQRIRVDERADQALVREFVDQLGKDGK